MRRQRVRSLSCWRPCSPCCWWSLSWWLAASRSWRCIGCSKPNAEKPGEYQGAPLSTSAPDPGYPYDETHDVRSGPDLSDDLLGLLPLVGLWRGTGKGGYDDIDDFDFAQEVRFSHDGRAFLAYESRTWVIDADGRPLRPYSRETGWWRPTGRDEIEVLLADPEGFAAMYVGTIDGTKFELATDAVMRGPSGKALAGEKRLYGIVDGDLMYAVDAAVGDHPLRPYMSARLSRL